MADEPTTPSPSSAPAAAGNIPPPAASPAPVVEAPVAAPPAETPAPAAPAADAPVTTEAPKAEAKAPGSLLGDAGTEPVAPAETPKEPAAPVDVTKPVYAALTLPEGVTLDDKQVNVFTDLVGDFELTTKADHAAVEGFRQKLADFYVEETRRQIQAQRDLWDRTREGWRNDFIADKDIGGNRQQTTLSRCAAMIEQYGGSPAQKKELRESFTVTGMGDHPAMIRFINNIARVLSEGKPVPATVPKSPETKGKAARRYNGSTLNGAN